MEILDIKDHIGIFTGVVFFYMKNFYTELLGMKFSLLFKGGGVMRHRDDVCMDVICHMGEHYKVKYIRLKIINNRKAATGQFFQRLRESE